MAAVGNIVLAGTTGLTGKPNGSFPFYMDDRWWAVFQSSGDSDFYIWEENPTTGVWSDTGIEVNDRGSDRPDVVTDPSANRMYSLGRHSSTPEISSCSLSSGTWTIDTNVTRVHVAGIDHADNCCLAIANAWSTHTLFAFDAPASGITMRHSTDHGQTWGTQTTIADGTDGRSTNVAMCDAIEFTWDDGGGDANYIGVVYGENSGGPGQYGFSYLKEGDTATTAGNWTHEVLPLTSVTGSPNSDDHVCITADDVGRIYVAFKSSSPNGVFVRDNDTSGTWSVHSESIGLASQARPCIIYDAGNDQLILTGAPSVPIASPKYFTAPKGTSGSWTDKGALFDDDASGTFAQINAQHAPGDGTVGVMFISATGGDHWESYIEPPASSSSIPIMHNHYRNLRTA